MLQRILLMISVCAIAAFAGQQPSTGAATPQRDPQAIATLTASITALGGLTALAGINAVASTGVLTPAPGSQVQGGTITWKQAGKEFRREFVGDKIKTLLVSGHGKAAAVVNGRVHHLHGQASMSQFPIEVPGVALMRALNDTGYTVGTLSPGVVAGRPATRILVRRELNKTVADLTTQVWFLDAANGLPLRVEYYTADEHNADSLTAEAVEFSHYQSISGVQVPFTLTAFDDGKPQSTITLNAVTFGQADPTAFDEPK